jgi:protein required for attachment to host cells
MMLIPHGAQIMVVDGAQMALFRNSGKDFDPNLELIEQEQNVTPRTSDIGDDQPGRAFKSVGGHRDAYEQTDYHQLLEDKFAMQACSKLEALLAKGEGRAILIAAPRVLGAMRKHLKSKTRERLIAEIDKDYAGRSAADVARMLGSFER